MAICHCLFIFKLRQSAVADLRGARPSRPPGSKFFQFHAVFGKIWQIRMLAPPGELARPPRGNPGSATDQEELRASWRLCGISNYQRDSYNCRSLKTLKVKKNLDLFQIFFQRDNMKSNIFFSLTIRCTYLHCITCKIKAMLTFFEHLIY